MNRKFRFGLIGSGQGTFIGAGHRITAVDLDFPTIDDGVEGMRFIAATVESVRQGARWVRPGSI